MFRRQAGTNPEKGHKGAMSQIPA